MIGPYRTAMMPAAETAPRGLVRSNGARCRCTPPGLLWCWWFDVGEGDRWFCKHAGEWLRERNRGNPFFEQYWVPAQHKRPDNEGATDK